MHFRHFLPGDIIINEGETAKSIFFVVKGQVEVMSCGGDFTSAVLDVGSYCKYLFFLRQSLHYLLLVGEIAALFATPRLTTVKALSKCVLAVLSASSLNTTLRGYPSVLEVIKSDTNERLLVTKVCYIPPPQLILKLFYIQARRTRCRKYTGWRNP